MEPLAFYNSLTRTIEPFQPLDPGNVRVYSCGPTVYNYAHIGNLRAYVFTDTLGRVLTWKGFLLTHVINITDVGHLTSDADAGDDKMEAAARARSQNIWDVAAHFTAAFKSDLKALNIRDPSCFPLATDHVAEMIAFGERIAERHCYQLDSGLYFDVTKVPNYGALAKNEEYKAAFDALAAGGDVAAMQEAADHAAYMAAAASRIDPVTGKRHPQDFAIWRTSAPGENRQMEWDSPWGRGAPGWHLECSVMSQKYLGERFDIHTGGIDHREIHHPNEIAQNQAHCCPDDAGYTGASVWMHNNFVVQRAGKMSKSTGDFLRLQMLIDAGVHPLAYRLLCLSAHYRSELEFTPETMGAALTRLKRLVMAVAALREQSSGNDALAEEPVAITEVMASFDAAVSDDLNTPLALVSLDTVLALKKVPAPWRLSAVLEMDRVLGLRLDTLARTDLRVGPVDAPLTEDAIAARLEERREARAARDFARSDAIRDDLIAAGVEVMDGDSLGWDWRPAL